MRALKLARGVLVGVRACRAPRRRGTGAARIGDGIVALPPARAGGVAENQACAAAPQEAKAAEPAVGSSRPLKR